MYLIYSRQPLFPAPVSRDCFDLQADPVGVRSLFDPGPQVQLHPRADNER